MTIAHAPKLGTVVLESKLIQLLYSFTNIQMRPRTRNKKHSENSASTEDRGSPFRKTRVERSVSKTELKK